MATSRILKCWRCAGQGQDCKKPGIYAINLEFATHSSIGRHRHGFDRPNGFGAGVMAPYTNYPRTARYGDPMPARVCTRVHRKSRQARPRADQAMSDSGS
jgi:hypothetical protein